MWDASALADNVGSLVAQIVESVDPESRDEAALAEAVSVKETKDELLRLRAATRLDSDDATDNTPSGLALIPSLAPALPSGVLVTPAMQDLLSKLTDPTLPRVGFVGM
eukprot:COSAG01_NODE_3870_length_5605_cov_4.345260_4_plen_108_part_00